MPRLLIVGYGNLLRGDDAVGRHTAERLRALVEAPDVQVLSLPQLTPELMETLSHVERAIFIDATDDGEPGQIRWRKIEPNAAGLRNLTHYLTPEALLAGARLLYGRAPEAAIVTVAGQDFALGKPMSQPVSEALEALVISHLSWPF